MTVQQAVEQQIELEKQFSKNQLMPRMRHYFLVEAETDYPTYIKEHMDLDFGIDFLVQMALHKRCDLQTMYGLMRHHFKDDPQACVNGLLLAVEKDLADYDLDINTFIVKFELPPELQAELDLFQYPLPMVVKPAEVVTNRDTGYLTNKGSIILKKNHHDNDVCLDHINRMNSIKLALNMDVVKFVSNSWKNLDRPKPGELGEDFQKRRKAFAKYDKTAKQVADILNENSDHFYLTHKYDKRGRTYCQGYHVTYQGNDWNKAAVEFYDREYVI